ncbi:MAG: type III-A CRISPR-associated protein Cas10/Csm1, partial [Methylococcales bacterium]
FNNDRGVCKIDGRTPAKIQSSDDWISELANDQINIGSWLVNPDKQRILITRDPLREDKSLSNLGLSIFGYSVSFTDDHKEKGEFGAEARRGNLLRIWDFSLPDKIKDKTLWNGYARRNINAYVPRFDGNSEAEQKLGKYGNEPNLDWGEAKTFNHIASEDKILQENHQWQGIAALSTLKGDIDNLGNIFKDGLGNDASFSKTAALSRQINNFFTVYLPWLCQSDACYSNTYTVFAGGDDFFLIGPWLSQIKLASHMRQAFQDYVADNKQVHFSAGISTTKPGLPINQLGEMAEEALDKAKSHNPDPKPEMPAPKNAVSCFGQEMFWEEFVALEVRRDRLNRLKNEMGLSTGYVYGLLTLIDMAEKVHEKPENALWHSYFAYRTVRMLERNKNLDKEQRKRWQAELAEEIANSGIMRHGGNYRVALFSHLYQQRD